jgi:ATP-dependent RNA helicase DDX23/PRP28
MPSSTLKPEDEGTELDEKRTYRTTYMFSATMPTAVERLARKYLRRSEAGVGGRGSRDEAQVSEAVFAKQE